MNSLYFSPGAGRKNPERAGMIVGAPLWLFAALLVTLTLAAWPQAALAEGELEGEITLGAQNVDIDHVSAHYGKFNGIDDKGTFLVGELELEFDRDLFYLELEGKDLGLDSRSIKLEFGSLGGYEVTLKFDQSPWLISSDAKTIYEGDGTADLTLPAGFTPGNYTGDMVDQLSSAARDIKLRVDRKTTSAEFEIPLGMFMVEVRYSSDKRDGTRPVIGALGTSGGNNRAVDLPGPVDYTTNDMSIALFWRSENAFAKLDFEASTFDNANEYLIWDNPFPTTVSGVNYPTRGKTSLPPSNTYQRFGLAGGLNDLPLNTSLSLNVDSATSKQNNDLADYSYNANSTVATPLPRSGAEAQIDVMNYAIKANSKPVDKLNVALEFRSYTTDNKTPMDTFIYIPLDSGVAQDGIDGGHALNNLPVDHSKTDMKADLAYTLAPATILKVGYLNQTVERSYREVAKTIEDKVNAGITHNFGVGNLRVNYASSSRKIDGHYEEAAVYDAYHTPEYVHGQNPVTAFDDHPLMRKYDIAARDRITTGATVGVWPSATFCGTLSYTAIEDKYGESEMGLTSSKGSSVTADVTVRPDKHLALFAFYTLDSMTAEQASRYYRGGGSKITMFDDPNNDWWATHEDKTPTIGLGAMVVLMDDKLDIGAYYSVSDSSTAITLTGNSGVGDITAMPDLKTKLTSIDVTAKYRFSDALTFGLGYAMETYTADNWSLDDVEPASDAIREVITMVPQESDFTANKAMVFIVWSLGK
ncbi:MAG: MtrB/PioB family decaheme-associated outer membrane protein [Nitrospinota bacterium]|nr:MtrB/PioB family decaheme-associated outer membrane protein [Nitrospinota bacterium]